MKHLLPALLCSLITTTASAGLVSLNVSGTIKVHTALTASDLEVDQKPFSASFVLNPEAIETTFEPAGNLSGPHSHARWARGCYYYVEGTGCTGFTTGTGQPFLLGFSISAPFWPEAFTMDSHPGAALDVENFSSLGAWQDGAQNHEDFGLTALQDTFHLGADDDDSYAYWWSVSLSFRHPGAAGWIPDMHNLSQFPDFLDPDLQVSFGVDDRLECAGTYHCYLRYRGWTGENLRVSVAPLQETPEPASLTLAAAALLALGAGRRYLRPPRALAR